MGAADLGSNVASAAADPGIRHLLDEQFAEPMTWARVASVAVVEEIAFRLFLMSVVAWIAARFLNETRAVFLTALIVSAFNGVPVRRVLPAAAPHEGLDHLASFHCRAALCG